MTSNGGRTRVPQFDLGLWRRLFDGDSWEKCCLYTREHVMWGDGETAQDILFSLTKLYFCQSLLEKDVNATTKAVVYDMWSANTVYQEKVNELLGVSEQSPKEQAQWFISWKADVQKRESERQRLQGLIQKYIAEKPADGSKRPTPPPRSAREKTDDEQSRINKEEIQKAREKNTEAGAGERRPRVRS